MAKETTNFWLNAVTERLESEQPITKEWVNLTALNAKRAYLTVNQFAMDRGTEIHSIIEAYLKGYPHETNRKYVDETLEHTILNELADKLEEYNFQVLYYPNANAKSKGRAIELEVHSHFHRYAGTLDLLGTIEINGEMHTCIIDFKTGKNVGEEAMLQMSAYWKAVEEMEEIAVRKIDQAFVLHVLQDGKIKKEAIMTDHDMPRHWIAFLHLRGFFPWWSKENVGVSKLF